MAILMDFDGIEGESIVTGYDGWHLLSGFAWGATRSLYFATDSGGKRVAHAQVPQVRNVTVNRRADSKTPQFWEKMLNSAAVAVSFAWLRTGPGASVEYLRVELKGALISAIEAASSGGWPEETITFDFATITIWLINVGDGLTGAQDVVSFDVPQHRLG